MRIGVVIRLVLGIAARVRFGNCRNARLDSGRGNRRRSCYRFGKCRTIDQVAWKLIVWRILEPAVPTRGTSYLAPGGAFLVEEESGLHYTGFSMRRE
jgi:hypothetical protein